MPDDERLDAGTQAKTGPIGISVRILWLAATLWGIYNILFDWPSKMPDTEILADRGFWVVTGFTVLLFSEVFNIVFRRKWGYRPVQMLVVLAVVALVVNLIVYEKAWEIPLAWLVWTADLFVFAMVAVSFLVGIPMRHRGCELGALPSLAARLRGQPDYDTSPCVVGMHRIDEWEDRRRPS